MRTQALRERRAALGGHVAARRGARNRGARLLPATDDRLRTWLTTPAGEFPFQEWFVARGHRDEVDAVRFEGEAEAAPGVLEALDEADLLLVAPSNPYVSIGPILAVAADPRGARRRAACPPWPSAR